MKLATIEIIKDVYQHPNAERLEFVKVCGYDCIVPKDKYRIGDWCILIQPDTVLPEEEWSEFYRKMSSKRVRASKIRGEWSFGIVEDTSLLRKYGVVTPPFSEGVDVSGMLGITKYIEPTPQEPGAIRSLPFQMKATYQDKWQMLDISSLYGSLCNVTQKIDGESFTVYYKDGQLGVCGRELEYRLDELNSRSRYIKQYDLRDKLEWYCQKHNINLALRGESYGRGIAKDNKHNPHNKLTNGVMFFSVWLIDKMEYALRGHKHNVFNVCRELDLPTVPLLEKDVVLTPELIQYYANLDKLNGEYFEGVVIDTGTKTFKVINLNYDSRK